MIRATLRVSVSHARTCCRTAVTEIPGVTDDGSVRIAGIIRMQAHFVTVDFNQRGDRDRWSVADLHRQFSFVRGARVIRDREGHGVITAAGERVGNDDPVTTSAVTEVPVVSSDATVWVHGSGGIELDGEWRGPGSRGRIGAEEGYWRCVTDLVALLGAGFGAVTVSYGQSDVVGAVAREWVGRSHLITDNGLIHFPDVGE